MTIREYLKYRERRFDDVDPSEFGELYQGYADGWHDAVKEIRIVLENNFDLDVTLYEPI